jgi:hypothetical protein
MGSFVKRSSLVSAALIALVLAPAASSSTPPPAPPPDTPSISQYVEQIPTSHGSSSPGVGRAQSKPLPPRVSVRLHKKHDRVSTQLEKVATSSSYGTPQRILPKPINSSGESDRSNALSAVVSAVSDSGDSHVITLLLAVVFVTTAMVWTALRLRGR